MKDGEREIQRGIGVGEEEYKQRRRSALSTPHASPAPRRSRPTAPYDSLPTTATPPMSSPSAALSVTKPTQRRTQHPTSATTLGQLDALQAEEASTLTLPSLSHPGADVIRIQPGLVVHLPPASTERHRDRAPSSVDRLLAGLQHQWISMTTTMDKSYGRAVNKGTRKDEKTTPRTEQGSCSQAYSAGLDGITAWERLTQARLCCYEYGRNHGAPSRTLCAMSN
ncbi:hypothetical protein AB1N83_012288 [Pleurotus pulmonarius]